MTELLYSIVEGLVENKDAVSITEKTDDNKNTTLVFTVAKSDMGRVIGKQGKIAKAIRTIVRAGAARQGMRIMVEIEEAE